MPGLKFFPLVSENGDPVAGNLGNEVNYPSDEVADTGKKHEDTHDESNDIFLLYKPDDAVNAADDEAEENLEKNFSDLR